MADSGLPPLPLLKKQKTEGEMAFEEEDEGEGIKFPVKGRIQTKPGPFTQFKYRCRVKNAAQLVTVASNTRNSAKPFKCGIEMNSIEIIENGGLIIDHNGVIVDIGEEKQIQQKYKIQ